MRNQKKMLSALIITCILFGLSVVKPAPAKAIKNFRVGVSHLLAGAISAYSFQFTFEGTLKPNQWKSFTFPPGTTLNPPMPEEEKERVERRKQIADAFSFGNREPQGFASVGPPLVEFQSDGSLNIRMSGGGGGLLVPDEPEGHTITMHFSEKAGICNPCKGGTYTYQLQTMDFSLMESQEVTIQEKVRVSKLETVGRVPVEDPAEWDRYMYPRFRKIKLANQHEGLVFIRFLNRMIYMIGLYDREEKTVLTEFFLCNPYDLEDPTTPNLLPDILVDSDNTIYASVREEINVFDNQLEYIEILKPNLKSFQIHSLLQLNFLKDNFIVTLRDDMVLFIDKKTGALSKNSFSLEKSKDPELVGLKACSVEDYTKDSILVYYTDSDHKKGSSPRIVVCEVVISSKIIKNKWTFPKKEFPLFPKNFMFTTMNFQDPYFFFWAPSDQNGGSGNQLYIVNAKTNKETLLFLPDCFLLDEWVEKEEGDWFAYIRCPDSLDGQLVEAVYRLPLRNYLKN